ncbi:trehalose utilization protein ThuA [Planctomycetales bacterium ZRK34]|nr:trehalose utilization protein ThuA [Planctomycetales bacterium ZRK34]
MSNPLRITIWHEYRHEKSNPEVGKLYPQGIHAVIRDGLIERLGASVEVKLAALDDADQGLSDDVLNNTDVLLWWGHKAHDEVADEAVERVQRRVLEGMGLIVLHSGHYSKIFKRLMGTGCGLRWREAGETERLWVVNPGHPIADGLGDSFELEHTEMYGELFDIPAPDELVFISWFAGGEVFRSGCCWTRGKGRVFYFRPGHETYPIYYDPNVRRVIANAVQWAAIKSSSPYSMVSPKIDPPQ